jgi:diaminohydroxyphosphoribosylaminopyrimidine deaminase/5-amino-6-(5-phosphoribosylamino)uracil reductase
MPSNSKQDAADTVWMRLALRLAARARGATSPNPLVGAVLVRKGVEIGRGWHRRAGDPHAEIGAIRDAVRRRKSTAGATLYVTLEPCCTHGRTPPCTDAVIAAGIRRVVVAATDPNPNHAGRGFSILRAAGIEVSHGVLEGEASVLNESFNHWIVHKTPFIVVKAAMTLDGKIATASGESKWITGPQSRRHAMTLRRGADAILVGVNTILADDPELTLRTAANSTVATKQLRRIILDSRARTPLTARVICDESAALTTVVVTRAAPRKRVEALARHVKVRVAPAWQEGIDLAWLLREMGAENVTSLLVEGGGEVNASFLLRRLAQRVAFFYAPKIIGGRDARKAVAGAGVRRLSEALTLRDVQWRRFGPDLFMTGRVV